PRRRPLLRRRHGERDRLPDAEGARGAQDERVGPRREARQRRRLASIGGQGGGSPPSSAGSMSAGPKPARKHSWARSASRRAMWRCWSADISAAKARTASARAFAATSL